MGSRRAQTLTPPSVEPTRSCRACGGTSFWRVDPIRQRREQRHKAVVLPGPWRCWNCEAPEDGIYDPQTAALARVANEVMADEMIGNYGDARRA